ncbi:MAG TPA: SpoIIE family protein phosphatase [Streptosporangiaceae bacterium]|jgi:serine phosphatase RsbU (regulator of sigma subunit)/PAS domain-containing protein|nr:SpoIIE family protein phosphatase [Streptosporangiaceae bacterium]
MPQPASPPELDLEVAALKERYAGLRQAAALPGADARAVLEAAFAELDTAVDVLGAMRAGPAPGPSQAGGPGPEALLTERRLLRAVFQDAPVPMFLLGPDATVQRVNIRGGELLGSAPGYAVGKLFTAFVDLPSRAAVQSQLAAVARTGKARRIQCRLLRPDGLADTELTVGLAQVRGDGDQLVVLASGPGMGADTGTQSDQAPRAKPADAEGPDAGPDSPARLMEAMIHRYDLVTSATRLFLENATYSESVTLQRCARLLASELGAWVIVDVERRQRLRRQFVMGPEDQTSVANAVGQVDPAPGTAPRQVHESGSSLLVAHAEDAGILGAGPQGVPVIMMLDATSVLCVPLSDGEHTYGTLTLARNASEGHFEMADLGVVEELGEQLALAIRVDRMFRRHTEIADALQSSLLPRDLPQIPGVEIAAAYVAATEGLEVGGDFYDVYRTPGGWGVAIGDVCGKGEEAAAVTAAARHAIRVLAHWTSDPAEVLAKANEVMLAEEFGDRFVTAKNAHLRWQDGRLHVVLGSAGHPGPVLVRPDGRTTIMGPGGLPLGLFPTAQAGREEVDLEPGDVLFFFTDGVTEARSPELTYFEDRLTDELAGLAGQPPRDIVAGLQTLVVEFCRNELRDDMTMLVLRVAEPPDQ